jgi:hypothetical protein
MKISKIILAITTAVLVASILMLVLFFNKQNTYSSKPLEAVPSNSILLWHTHSARNVWQKLAFNSIMWQSMRSHPSFESFHQKMSLVDSIASNHVVWQKLFEESEMTCSFHLDEMEQLSYLMVFKLSREVQKSDIQKSLNDFLDHPDFTELGISENSVELSFMKHRVFGEVFQDMLFLSNNHDLIDSAKSTLQHKNGIISDSAFLEVFATAGKEDHGTLFLNYKAFSSTSKKVFNNQSAAYIQQGIDNAGTWAALDVSVKSNELHLRGFTLAQDNFLSRFNNQELIKSEAMQVVPNTTAAFLHLGFSNFAAWVNSASENQKIQLTRFETNYGFSYEEDMLSWMEHEALAGQLSVDSQLILQRFFAVTKSSNPDLSVEKLRYLSHLNRLENHVTEEYAGYELFEIACPQILHPLLGKPFEKLVSPFAFQTNKFVIWANNVETLKGIINALKSAKTLANDSAYKQFNERLSADWNIYLYFNSAMMSEYSPAFLSREFLPLHDSTRVLFGKYYAFGIQWSRERDNLYYHNALVHYNPIHKKQSNSLWEIALDAPVKGSIYPFTNHYTNASEVIVQDTLNQLYHISNNGQILWKRKMNEEIIGKIHQIDLYSNNKYQIVFSTSSKMYVIDRMGRDVEGYPIEFESTALSGVSVVKYNDAKDYRFLIACQNQMIYNFDPSGKKLKGWEYKKMKHISTHALEYMNIQNKDYLLCVYKDGSIVALDRRGKQRLNFKNTIPTKGSQLNLFENKSLESSFILCSDTNAIVYKLFISDSLMKESFDDVRPFAQFIPFDILKNAIPEYCFASSNDIKVYDNNQKLLINYTDVDAIGIDDFQVHNFGREVLFSYSREKENQIWVLDKLGHLLPNMPLRGKGKVVISDLNQDGKYNLIVCDTYGLLYCYELY